MILKRRDRKISKKISAVKKSFIFFAVFIFVSLVYYLTSAGNTPYDYFTRLSASFLEGKLYLEKNPPWLNELVPAGENKFFVVYPPMPAILSTPFVLLFKNLFKQQYLSHLMGGIISILVLKLSMLIKKDKGLAVWSVLFVSFGTIIWFLSSTGSAWYLAHVTSFFFLTLALIESLSKKRPFLTGIYLGASYLSRLPTILSAPFFILTYLDPRKKKSDNYKNITKLLLGVAPFVIFNFIYNYLRFGTVFDEGYFLIPGVLEEPWFQKGIFDLSYIPRNLKAIFLSFPVLQNTPPYILPSWSSLAIWITTPLFVFSLFAKAKEKIVRISWLTIFLISLVIFSHGTYGFTQFGYRYAVDFYPFLVFLTIKGASGKKLTKYHWLLLFVSIAVNLWGVLWINKFSWVI